MADFVDVTDPSYKNSDFVDVTDPSYKPPVRSAPGELGTALARGALVDLPSMAGQVLKYASSPGQGMYDFGEGLRQAAEARGSAPGLTLHPEAHGAVVNALAQGAQMVPSIAGTVLPAMGLAATLPVSAPVGGAITAAVMAAPFAAAAGQETLDKAAKAHISDDKALGAARLNAGVTFGTQALLAAVGGKLFAPSIFSNIVKRDGAELAASTLADMTGKSGAVMPFLKQLPFSAGEAVTLGGTQAAATAEIERRAGIDNQDPLRAAMDQVPAMLGLTAIGAPFALLTRSMHANTMAKRTEALASADTHPTLRANLADQYVAELAKIDPEAARTFERNARTAIIEGLPLSVDAGLFQQGAVRGYQQPPGIRPLPGPDDIQGPPAPPPPPPPRLALPAPPEAPPGAPGLPNKVPFGGALVDRSGPTPEQRATEADVRARQREEDRAAEENRRQQAETHIHILNELRARGIEPEPSLSYPEFLRVMQNEAKKAGMKPDDITPREYDAMWHQHQQDVMAANTRKAIDATAAEREAAAKADAQMQREAEAEINRAFQAGLPPKPPKAVGPEPRSALAVAIEDAIRQKQIEEAYRQHEKTRGMTAEQADQLQRRGQGVRQVEQLLAEAQAAARPTPEPVPPYAPPRKAGPEPRSAMAVALETAMQRRAAEEAARQRQQEVEAAHRQHEPAGMTQEQADRLQNIGRGTRLAEAAAAGTLPARMATVPMKPDRMVLELRSVLDEGMKLPPKVAGALAKAVTGAKSLEDQVKEIRALRDKSANTTLTYELLDKLATKLGGVEHPVEEMKGEARAVQEPSAAAVPVREAPGGGEGVRGGNAEGRGAAGAREEKPATAEGHGEKAVAAEKPAEKSAEKPAGKPAEKPVEEKRGGGRTKGTTDERHTVGPPTEAGDLYPYRMSYSEAKGQGIFTEKAWWKDLAWVVRNPDTKIGRQVMENGKFTDEQMAEAVARANRYDQADAMLEGLRNIREERLRQIALAEAQPEKAKEILKAKDLRNIFGGEEEDYKAPIRVGQTDESEVVSALAKGGQYLNGVLDRLLDGRALKDRPDLAEVVRQIRALNLDTRIAHISAHEGSSTYTPAKDIIRIAFGGANAETVVHEAVHAATANGFLRAAEMYEAIRNGTVDKPTKEQLVRAQAYKDFLDVWADANAAAQRSGSELYGFKSPLEFIAETLSSQEFQYFLHSVDSGGKSLWRRFVEGVKALLGIKTPAPLLERALTVSQSFLSKEPFRQSPEKAAGQTDLVLNKIVKAADVPLSFKDGFTRAHLYFASFNHIKQVFKEVLPQAYRGVLDTLGMAMDRGKATTERMNREALEISRKMYALADKATGLDRRLYELMGESARQGIFPDRPLAQQAFRNPTPEQVRKYNELRQIYQSNPDVARVFDEAAAHNKKQYDSTFASVIRNIGRYSGVPDNLWRAIDERNGYSPEVQAVQQWMLQHGTDQQRLDMRAALAHYQKQQQGPYFHLGRSGDFFLRYDIADHPASRATYDREMGTTTLAQDRVIAPEDRHVFARLESESEYRAAEAKLKALQDAGHVSDLTSGKVDKNLSGFDTTAPSFIRNLIKQIETDSRIDDPADRAMAADAVRRLAIEMMPETSASKAFAQRKGVAGYDVDMNRNFVRRASAAAFFVGHTANRPEIEESMLGLREAVKDRQDATSPNYDVNKGMVTHALNQELRKRQANEMLPVRSPTLDLVSAMSHAFYLAANPAFLLMKTLQPWQIALPQLGARHGFVRSFGAMANATGKALGIIKDSIGDGWQADGWHGVLDPHISVDRSRANADEKKFLHALIDAGGVEFTQAHDIGRIAAGTPQGASTAVKVGNMMLHYSEALDRMTAGLAAFNLEMKRTNGDFGKATQYAIQNVKNSLYDYNTHNKGRMFSKQGMFSTYTPLLTQFAQYQVQTIELMSRLAMDAFGKLRADMTPEERQAAITAKGEARRTMAGLMATTSVLAGTLGLPATTVIGAVYNALFGDEDHPVDAQADYRNFLNDTFGKEVGEVIAHGALRAAGTDIGASHLGFQDILPFSRFLADRRQLKDRFDSGVLQMMGPAVGAASGFALGATDMANGRYMKGLEAMLPSGLKGVAKAVDLSEHGLTDIRGNRLPVAINSWDLFNQFLNSTPSKVAEQREAQRSANTHTQLLKERSSNLTEQFAIAVERQDGETMKDVMNQIVAFNQKNPAYAIRDLRSVLRMRAIERAVAAQTGVEGRARLTPQLQEASRYANIGSPP